MLYSTLMRSTIQNRKGVGFRLPIPGVDGCLLVLYFLILYVFRIRGLLEIFFVEPGRSVFAGILNYSLF